MKNLWPYAQSQWMLVSIPPGGEPEPEPGLDDGDSVTTWEDSSGNGNDATQSGSARPIFKTNIINGLPVVRFTSAASSRLNLTSPISSNGLWTILTVMKRATGIDGIASLGSTVPTSAFGNFLNTDGYIYYADQITLARGNDPNVNAFEVVSTRKTADTIHVNGTPITVDAPVSFVNATNFGMIGVANAAYGNGDIAEIIIYSAQLGFTDRGNVEKYLGTKYAITVAGGTAVQPDTVSGLQGWWKADSLLG